MPPRNLNYFKHCLNKLKLWYKSSQRSMDIRRPWRDSKDTFCLRIRVWLERKERTHCQRDPGETQPFFLLVWSGRPVCGSSLKTQSFRISALATYWHRAGRLDKVDSKVWKAQNQCHCVEIKKTAKATESQHFNHVSNLRPFCRVCCHFGTLLTHDFQESLPQTGSLTSDQCLKCVPAAQRLLPFSVRSRSVESGTRLAAIDKIKRPWVLKTKICRQTWQPYLNPSRDTRSATAPAI